MRTVPVRETANAVGGREGGGEAVGHRPFLDIEHDPNNFFFPIKALFSDSFRYLVTKF